MASFKLNIAQIDQCPAPRDLAAAMEEFGLPETEEFGVLNCSATDQSVFASVVRKTQQAVQKLDADSGELTSAAVEKATVYPIGVRPDTQRLEIYAGSAAAIEQIAAFLGSCLALPTVVEAIELDIPAAIEKLSQDTPRFQLKSMRVADYAHNSYMAGVYAPKFLDSEHGMEFLEQYVESVTTASVKFQGPSGRVTVSLTPKACFGFSCNEDDVPVVQSILRKLI